MKKRQSEHRNVAAILKWKQWEVSLDRMTLKEQSEIQYVKRLLWQKAYAFQMVKTT